MEQSLVGKSSDDRIQQHEFQIKVDGEIDSFDDLLVEFWETNFLNPVLGGPALFGVKEQVVAILEGGLPVNGSRVII